MSDPAVDALAARLQSVWTRSDRVFGLLAPDAMLAQPITLRHPFLFYLGHLPAFGWNQLGAGALGRPPVDDAWDVLFERGIDPLDEGSRQLCELCAHQGWLHGTPDPVEEDDAHLFLESLDVT